MSGYQQMWTPYHLRDESAFYRDALRPEILNSDEGIPNLPQLHRPVPFRGRWPYRPFPTAVASPAAGWPHCRFLQEGINTAAP